MASRPARIYLAAVTVALVMAGAPAMAAPAPAGSWRAPLDGPLSVTRAFAPGARDWLPGHRGVDLSATPGATVRSAGAGLVSFAGVLAGRGVVTVTHGELRTTYEPVDVLVAAGQRVNAGSLLGRLVGGHGDPGPGRALLHWGLRRGADYLDPMTLLGRGPVRLLPRWTTAVPPPRGSVSSPPLRPRVEPAAKTSPANRGGRPGAGTAVVLGLAGLAAVGRRARRPDMS